MRTYSGDTDGAKARATRPARCGASPEQRACGEGRDQHCPCRSTGLANDGDDQPHRQREPSFGAVQFGDRNRRSDHDEERRQRHIRQHGLDRSHPLPIPRRTSIAEMQATARWELRAESARWLLLRHLDLRRGGPLHVGANREESPEHGVNLRGIRDHELLEPTEDHGGAGASLRARPSAGRCSRPPRRCRVARSLSAPSPSRPPGTP